MTGATAEPAAKEAPIRSSADLVAAGRAIAAPFRLELHLRRPRGRHRDKTPPGVLSVLCERVLRVLPGRRVVAMVWVGDTPMLLKLHLGRAAARHAAREARGSALLVRAGVPAPQRLGYGRTADGAGHVLLYEFLENFRPLDEKEGAGVARAAAELAALHAVGGRHVDPHLDNFLLGGPEGATLRFVDADGIRPRPGLSWSTRELGRRASLRNLAMFCAVRPIACDVELGRVLNAYAEARRWPAEQLSVWLAELTELVRRERRLRLQRYVRKSERPSREFHVERNARETRLCVMDHVDTMAGFFADPEAVMRAGAVVKDGNSATVVRATIGGRTWIVKRYNVKNPWHRLRRSLRPVPRYRNAWRQGHRLHLAGVPTARPAALLERRSGLLRNEAYLVMEDAGDRDLLNATRSLVLDEVHVAAVVELFRALETIGVTHGDTKATNFLVQGTRIVLVDLDGMRTRPADVERDRARFLANWRDAPAVQQRFADAFRSAGLSA
jgi:tRNA A-37 threonylcarbamoyl transferase component Bud32